MNRFNLIKVGRYAISAVIIGGSVSVVNCTPSWTWTPSKAFTVPEPTTKWDTNWDKREKMLGKMLESNKKGSGKKVKATRHLIFIRHGQFTKNKPESERFLTKLGKKQAEYTGRRLKSSGIHFDSITSSDFNRAIQTAEIIVEQIGQEGLSLDVKDPILQEGLPPAPEPMESFWDPSNKFDFEYYECGPRFEAAFRKYFHRAKPSQEKDSYEIIVCHHNLIRYFICRALQFPGNAWTRFDFFHCSVTVFSILPNGLVTVNALGDAGHLPFGMKSNVYEEYKTPI